MTQIYDCITELHDLRLVVLAALICVLACFTTISLFVRAADAERGRNIAWISAAALVFGAGIWTTHFVAVLAYRPGMPIGYDISLTALSVGVAVCVSWAGMFIAQRFNAPEIGGGISGAAVGAMHYLGMAAMRAPATQDWDFAYVVASVAIGVLAAAAALRVLSLGPALRHRVAAALLLVAAICGMHFTGMAGVTLIPDPLVAVPEQLLPPALLAIVISAMAFLIIALGLSGSIIDQHLALNAGREAERLRQSREHLARAQRLTHTGSIERNLRTGSVEWSAETYRIFGLAPDQPVVASDRFLELFHPDDRHRYQAVTAASEAGQVTGAVQCRVIRPDGIVRWIHHESEVFLDDDGTPARWIGTFADITQAREAEERQRLLQEALQAAREEAECAARAVQAANEDLERRVEERTAQLSAMQGELLKKERLSTLGQLTATVAHELRNPLSAIRNTVFTVKETAAAKGVEITRPVARLERSIERCNQIITDLLEFSRQPSLQCESRNVDQWLRDLVGEQSVPAEIAIELDLRTGMAKVSFDPERFRRVIINLLDNAMQALTDPSRSGTEKRIVLRTCKAGDRIEIIVQDTGAGISPENLAKVFEPLFSTKSFGTGLGLPTVKQIVEQHGGEIEIRSQIGHGTTATVRLPLAAEELAA